MKLIVGLAFLVGITSQIEIGINVNHGGVQADTISNSTINIIYVHPSNDKKKCVAIWFEEKHERGIHYSEMKKRCKAAASAIEDTVGFPAFFRSKEEYDQYRNTVGNRAEYLGYEQQFGDNDHWVNADGTEITFTDWDNDWQSGFSVISPQPDNDSENCAITGWAEHREWHDGPCSNPINAYYSCRFEQKSDNCNRQGENTLPQKQGTKEATTNQAAGITKTHFGPIIKKAISWTEAVKECSIEYATVAYINNDEDLKNYKDAIGHTAFEKMVKPRVWLGRDRGNPQYNTRDLDCLKYEPHTGRIVEEVCDQKMWFSCRK